MARPAVTPEELGALETFRSLDAGDLSKLAAIAELREYPAGTLLFKEGEPSTDVFVVERGRVSLTLGLPGRPEWAFLTLGPGELLGWSGFSPSWNRVASARTLEPTALFRLDGQTLRQLCEDDHDIGYAVMRCGFEVVSQRLQDTRVQLLDLFGAPEPPGAGPLA